jgi:hypothetical protein
LLAFSPLLEPISRLLDSQLKEEEEEEEEEETNEEEPLLEEDAEEEEEEEPLRHYQCASAKLQLPS